VLAVERQHWQNPDKIHKEMSLMFPGKYNNNNQPFVLLPLSHPRLFVLESQRHP